ncbi:MAG: sugar kinase [Proteobacteria bacterium]|nr:sugar kinase [Pseudomonadota bacterium]MBU0965540.1 sugar kinase [Pseudomonadota bacterium]
MENAQKPAKQSLEIDIIGGPFDRITTVLKEFEPGDKEFIKPLQSYRVDPRSVGEVEEREVEVQVPARLHPTVFDMNRFNLNRAGGGGLGLAIKVYFHAKVKAIKEPKFIIKGERTLIMEHFCHIFKELLSYPGGFEVELYDHKRRHVGMGSSIGSMLAVCIGINEVLGRPFSGRELRRIIGYHSCEESPNGNGYLMPAFETGMGAMVGVNGGWIIGTDDLEMVYRVPLPDTKCIVFIPDVPSLEDEFLGKETAAASEVELLLRRARYLDSMQSAVKAQLVLYDMLPAMIKNDLRGIGDAMFDLTFLGSKRAECEQHGCNGAAIYNYISTFREIGAEVAGMSSVGPTIFSLTRSDETYERILKYLRTQGIPESRIIETEVDNVGGRVRENGVERIFQHDGWLQG